MIYGIKQVRRRLSRGVMLGIMLAAVASGTALAHATEIHRHYGWAYSDATHDHANACDLSSDGFQVKVQARDGAGLREVTDPDGAGGSCGHLDGLNFIEYRLCKVTVDCSEWRQN